jgi:hypothetical protein
MQAGGLEKRGPVEFNHAISYVNKIKVPSEISLFSNVASATLRLPPRPTLLSFGLHFRLNDY